MFRTWSTSKLINITLAYFLCFPAILGAVNNITHTWFGTGFKWGTYGVFFVYWIFLFIVAGRISLKGLSFGRLAFAFFVIVSFMFADSLNDIGQYIWTNAKDLVGNPLYNFIFMGLLGFFVSDYLDDIEGLLHYLEKFSLVTIFLALVQYILAISGGEVPEYMTFSYNILFPTVLLLLLTISEFKWKRMFFAMVGGCLILVAGCRGALVCLLLVNLLYIVFLGKISSFKRVVLCSLLVLLVGIIFLYWDKIIALLINFMESLGVDSRTLIKLKEESFFEDSGRYDIQKKLIPHIGIMPKGVFADRVYADGYAHNIFIELLIDYGYLIGGVMSFMLIIFIFRAVKYADRNYRILLITLLSSGVIKLMMSGSFVNVEPCFYTLLGVGMNVLRRKSEIKV